MDKKYQKITLKNIFGFLWIIILCGSLYYYITIGITIDGIEAYLSKLGIWSGFFFIIAYIIRPLIFFPTSIMTPLSAVLFGPVLGWIYTYIGENLSATVAFFVARYLGRNFVKENENTFIKKYDDKLRCCGFETILMFRLIPLFPFDFVNYVSGLSAIRYHSFISATLLGVVPGLTAYILLGSSLSNPYLFVPTIILFTFISWIAHKKHSSHKKLSKKI